MGRPPCCDKVGVKKGPWTPEEDIMLVSYVQEHGPGNWRAVPTNTGLRRCSKSCRLRWTNYLRPGIRRGEFTDDEEKMIIQLQALLGNKWAAIASYLPERTDNDIKNYWNTHLKKKLKKIQAGTSDHSKDGFSSSSSSHLLSRGQWEKRLQTDIHMAKQALHDALSLDKPAPTVFDSPDDHHLNPVGSYLGNFTKPSQTAGSSTYASSTENIAKLLKGFMKSSPKSCQTKSSSSTQHSFNSNAHNNDLSHNSNSSTEDQLPCVDSNSGIDLSVAFESLFGFDQSNFDSSNSDFSQSNTSPEASLFQDESKPDISALAPLSMFENWFFDHDQGGGVLQGKASDLANFAFDENPDLF